MRTIVLSLIRLYQKVISPITGQNCRFYPSCSHYGHQAIQRHGVVKGGWLTIKRLAKCHPWHPGGVDDVPGARNG
ncbi:MAG: membrane protein insertion efficiency factor YidD [Pseudomonadota bacterium]